MKRSVVAANNLADIPVTSIYYFASEYLSIQDIYHLALTSSYFRHILFGKWRTDISVDFGAFWRRLWQRDFSSSIVRVDNINPAVGYREGYERYHMHYRYEKYGNRDWFNTSIFYSHDMYFKKLYPEIRRLTSANPLGFMSEIFSSTLEYCFKWNHTDIIDIILSSETNLNALRKFALCGLQYSSSDVTVLMLLPYCSYRQDDYTAFCDGMKNLYSQRLMSSLRSVMDMFDAPDYIYQDMFDFAAARDDVEMMMLAHSRGAYDGRRALKKAVRFECISAMRYIMSNLSIHPKYIYERIISVNSYNWSVNDEVLSILLNAIPDRKHEYNIISMLYDEGEDDQSEYVVRIRAYYDSLSVNSTSISK